MAVSIEQAEGRGELRGLGEFMGISLVLDEVRGDCSLVCNSRLSLECSRPSWEHSELVRFASSLPDDGGGGAARFFEDRMEERESLLPFMEERESLLPCDLREEPKRRDGEVERRDSTSARSFSPTDEFVARAAST